MCVNCQHYRYRDECLSDCNRPMLYGVPDDHKQCFDCSPECNTSCTGPVRVLCSWPHKIKTFLKGRPNWVFCMYAPASFYNGPGWLETWLS